MKNTIRKSPQKFLRVKMSGINEKREKQIEELDGFIQMIQKRLKNIVFGLGWTLESISKENQSTVICPFNNGHQVREKSLDDHLEKCQWKSEGYMEHDLPLSEPCPSVNALSIIKFDEQLQDLVLLKARNGNPTMSTEINQCCPWNTLNAIAPAAGVADRLIPRTSDRLTTSFTSDEKKTIYDYVIANTIKPDIGDDIADMNRLAQKDGDPPKTSLLELLAQERNLKRRRAKHRGVHTNKKSQVEILREVINHQMDMYEEYLGDTKIKSQSKSPCKSEAGSFDLQACPETKYNQEIKYEPVWPRRSSGRNDSKYFDRESNLRTFSPAKRSPASDFGFNCDSKKRNRSESREGRSKKHHSKHKKDRSRDRARHEERRKRHCLEDKRKDKSRRRVEVYQSEDKSDRKKRHRSRDCGSKTETTRGREKSSETYYREERRLKTDRNRKRNY